MSIPLRLALVYSALFLGTGVSLPFIGVWLGGKGLSGAQIGLILSAPMLGRVLTAPVLAVWADGFSLRRTPIALLAGGAAVAYGALLAVQGLGAWMLCWFVAATLLPMITPLTDVMTMRRARSDGFNYGWPRGIGSVAYIVANVSMGALLTRLNPNVIVIWTAVAAIVTAGAAMLLPRDPVHEGGERPARRDRWRGIGGLLRDRTFMLMALSVGFIQAAHAFYYGFSVLLWREQGISEAVIGLLWGTGVAVEVGFMWFGERWRRSAGPERLLIIGGLAAVVRWTAFAFAPPVGVLFALQALHAMTFAATFMASLSLVERLSPPQSASAAQTLNSALSSGLMIGLATIASGPIFDRFGGHGYLAMALLAVIGVAGGMALLRRSRA
ncbi:MFS transporter [Caulobacter sp. NIBR2454]|uniref:MFS transporter n=1 Tax=Caulobacter sp. NIBR2454 TaxID=3015996 RepID=UPI0022B6B617|nr:MFS transporter [Caulobacter sp. NIBR2454]